MKKIIYKLTYLTALFAFIYSCDDVERVYYNDAAETVLSLSDDNLVLNEENAANEILTLTWTEPDLVSVQQHFILYKLMFKEEIFQIHK